MSLALATVKDTDTYGFSPKEIKRIGSKALMTTKVSKMSVKNATVSWKMKTDDDGMVSTNFPWGTPPDIVARAEATLHHTNKAIAVKNRLRARLATKKN